MNHLSGSLQAAASLMVRQDGAPSEFGKTCLKCGKFRPITSFLRKGKRICARCYNDRALFLRTGRTERLPRKKKIEPRDKFGRWTIIRLDRYFKRKNFWLCRCSCGTEKVLSATNLHAGRTQSCGCITSEFHKARSLTTAANRICRTYKFHADRRALGFEITREDIADLMIRPCHYCGVKGGNCMTLKSGMVRYNGIDRIDNSKGYHRDNVVACCGDCNLAKLARGAEEFVAWAKRIAERHS